MVAVALQQCLLGTATKGNAAEGLLFPQIIEEICPWESLRRKTHASLDLTTSSDVEETDLAATKEKAMEAPSGEPAMQPADATR